MRAAGVVALVGLAGVSCTGDDGDSPQSEATEAASTAEQAPDGVVQVLMPQDIEQTRQPLSGAVGTETMRLALVGSGEVEEIGRGRAARQPAAGEKFVVVELEKQKIDITTSTPAYQQAEMVQRGEARFSIQVGAAAPREINLDVPSYTPLPIDLDEPPQSPPAADQYASQRRLLVVSVPQETESLDLVVTSSELEQRVSLLTGQSGAGHVAMLARENRVLNGAVVPQDVSYTMTEFGLTGSDTQPVGVVGATLQWSVGVGPSRRAAEPGRAILQISMDTIGINMALASELRLADGTVLQPLPPLDEILASTDPTVSFDVPPDFTSGVLVLGKDYTWEVSTGGSISLDFDAPVEYLIEIPLTKPA